MKRLITLLLFTAVAAQAQVSESIEVRLVEVTVTVSDADGALVTRTYTVNVTGADDAPTLGAVSDATVAEDDQAVTTSDAGLSGTLVGADVDV